MVRRFVSFVALVLAVFVLGLRIRQINTPVEFGFTPRTVHVLYLDSLRRELLTFSEQYGRPVFQYDTVAPVTGHGRIQMGRLRQALFDPRVEYRFGDEGFDLDWRGDPKPRRHGGAFMRFGVASKPSFANAWPTTAAEYARARRLFVTPQWPEPPQRPADRPRRQAVPPHGDAMALLALATSH